MSIEAELPDGRILEFPDGTDPAVIQQTVRKVLGVSEAPQRSTGEDILRKAQLGAKGITDSVAGTLGALPDAVAWGVNKAGEAFGAETPLVSDPVGGSNFWKRTFKAVGKPEGALYDAMGINLGGDRPEDTTEKAIYGGAKGVADAASIFLPANAIANTAKAGTMTQGIAKTLSSQPVLQGLSGAAGGAVGEATDNPLLGIAAAVGVPLAATAATKALSPNLVRLGDLERQIVTNAKREGIPLATDQVTGNKTLQMVQSVLRKLPISGNFAEKADDATRAAFNRAVLKRAGVDATKATPEVIDDAFRLAGQSFDDLIARTPEIALRPQFFDKIDDVVASYGKRLPRDVSNVFRSYVNDLNTARQAATQPGSRSLIDGGTYKRIYSDLSRSIRNASNDELASALTKLRGALDDEMLAAVPKGLASEWKDVRRAYATLTAVAKAMAKGGQTADTTGNIPFGAFKNEVRRGDPTGYARGRGQLNELARIGSFLADKVPDSGTAPRQFIQNLFTGGGVMGGAAAGGVPGAAAGLVASLATPAAAYGALNNPVTRWWMTNQLAAGMGPSGGAYGGILSGRTLDQIKQILEQQP